MRRHLTTLGTGIQASPEFAKKGLADYAVNPGTKCGHDCTYCSTGSLLRMHRSFKAAGESPFTSGFAIVDPATPERVARDAARIRSRGMVQLSSTVDSWAPECQEYLLGRRCLEAILAEPGWSVRVLTKNAAVENDFDLVATHRDRVLVGLSLTGTRADEGKVAAFEPHASPISKRIATLREAHRRGLRTFGMLCPLLPGIADDHRSISGLVQICLACGAEEIFVEPVNARGAGLPLTQAALEAAGFHKEAAAIEAIRSRQHWSAYCAGLIVTVQQVMRELAALKKLRFLLYPGRLTKNDLHRIREDDAGVRWLGNGSNRTKSLTQIL
jgi:DNA repair photolyase